MSLDILNHNNKTQKNNNTMFTIEKYFSGNANEWCYLIRNQYGNIFCRVYTRDFSHSDDPYLLAYNAAKEIVENLNNSISY